MTMTELDKLREALKIILDIDDKLHNWLIHNNPTHPNRIYAYSEELIISLEKADKEGIGNDNE